MMRRENNQIITEYTSDKIWLLWVALSFAVLVGLGVLENGSEHLPRNLILSLLGFGFFWIVGQRTYATIENNRILTNAFDIIRKPTVDIYKIERIERAQAFIVRAWGSRMLIYSHSENGELVYTPLQESSYNVEDIRRLLGDIKRINPSVELAPIYEKLIRGDEEVVRDLKYIPAERATS